LNSEKDEAISALMRMAENSQSDDRKEYDEIFNERKELDRQVRIKSTLDQIPIRFREVGPVQENMKEAICSIIWGGFGTGKTWAAYALVKDLVQSGEIKSFKVLTEVGLINEIKAGFSDGTFSKRMKDLENVDLLVVDEIGKSNDTDFNKAQLFEILNNRYNWMRRTVLICNATDKAQVREIMPTATLDRFRENVIQMQGKSRRYNGQIS
jgi:DNA replication protein DnaC